MGWLFSVPGLWCQERKKIWQRDPPCPSPSSLYQSLSEQFRDSPCWPEFRHSRCQWDAGGLFFFVVFFSLSLFGRRTVAVVKGWVGWGLHCTSKHWLNPLWGPTASSWMLMSNINSENLLNLSHTEKRFSRIFFKKRCNNYSHTDQMRLAHVWEKLVCVF